MMMFAPNGRSVSSRVRAMRRSISSGGMALKPRTPHPPAFETAAASSGPAPSPKPTEKIGRSIPSRSQSAVRNIPPIFAWAGRQIRVSLPLVLPGMTLAEFVSELPALELEAGGALQPHDLGGVALLVIDRGLVVLRSAVPGSARRTITCHAGSGALILSPAEGESL